MVFLPGVILGGLSMLFCVVALPTLPLGRQLLASIVLDMFIIAARHLPRPGA